MQGCAEMKQSQSMRGEPLAHVPWPFKWSREVEQAGLPAGHLSLSAQ